MRKTIISALELAVVLCFFLLPPVFAKTTGVYVVSAYYSGVSVFLFTLYSCRLFISAGVGGKSSRKPLKIVLYAALCAVALAASAGLTNALSRFAGGVPETVIEGEWSPGVWFFANNVLGAFVFASFEEILYRVFLPTRLRSFKIPVAAAYSISLVFFALAHRPLGIWGIANALLCGASLQYCYKKTGSAAAICAVHGAYNLVGRALVFFP
jgi:membrane protease YdiL (CAAX protease family)